MGSLSRNEIYDLLVESIGDEGEVSPNTGSLPYTVSLKNSIVDCKIYIWNVIFTCELSNKRPKDEYRINFNIYPRSVEWSPTHLPVYCGYCSDYGVFVLWDSRRHDPEIKRGNMQVKTNALIDGDSFGYCLSDRFVERGIETIIVCTPAYFVKALKERYEIYLQDLERGRPDTKLTSHSNHNNYGPIYRYCVDNPGSTTFDVAYHFHLTVEESRKCLSTLKATFDYPIEPLGDEEVELIRNKIKNLQKINKHISISEILKRMHISKEYAKRLSLTSPITTLDDYMDD